MYNKAIKKRTDVNEARKQPGWIIGWFYRDPRPYLVRWVQRTEATPVRLYEHLYQWGNADCGWTEGVYVPGTDYLIVRKSLEIWMEVPELNSEEMRLYLGISAV